MEQSTQSNFSEDEVKALKLLIKRATDANAGAVFGTWVDPEGKRVWTYCFVMAGQHIELPKERVVLESEEVPGT